MGELGKRYKLGKGVHVAIDRGETGPMGVRFVSLLGPLLDSGKSTLGSVPSSPT